MYSIGDPSLLLESHCATASAGPVSGTLTADSVQGLYFDLSSQNILVSPGETIAFQNQDSGDDFPTTDDRIPGTAMMWGGVRVPAIDLVFKSFVLPAADLAVPRLSAHVAGPTVLLTWTASPGAVGYDVLDSTDATVIHTADTHAAVAIVPASGQAYRVRAAAASGTSVTSDAVGATAGANVSIAENLCGDTVPGGTSARSLGLDSQLTQTFTVTQAGKLSTVEAEVSGDNFLQVAGQVQDSAGNALASFQIPSQGFTEGFGPLSPYFQQLTTVDVSSSAVQVNAGDKLRLVVGPAPFPFGFQYGVSGDDYAGGELAVPNGTAAQDLCFRVTVVPN